MPSNIHRYIHSGLRLSNAEAERVRSVKQHTYNGLGKIVQMLSVLIMPASEAPQAGMC